MTGEPDEHLDQDPRSALVAAALVTFGAIDLMAAYAYPSAPALRAASVAR